MTKIDTLKLAYEQTTQGRWSEGRTSHHTVCNGGRYERQAYPIGEFHHATDAEFVDYAHEHWQVLMEALQAVDYLHDDLKSLGYGEEDEIKGADLVDLMQAHFERVQTLMRKLK